VAIDFVDNETFLFLHGLMMDREQKLFEAFVAVQKFIFASDLIGDTIGVEIKTLIF
jgi:hypothetical protein